MKTFSKNALMVFLLCLHSTQALVCSSEQKKSPILKKLPKIFTFTRATETPAVNQDFYKATPIAPRHVARIQEQLKKANPASGFSKESKIEYYTSEGKDSFTLGNKQILCAQESPQTACPVNVVEFLLNSKKFVAIECYLHGTYHKLERIKTEDTAPQSK